MAQRVWTADDGWRVARSYEAQERVDLVFCFAPSELLRSTEHLSALRSLYPEALLVGCSTAGEIHGDRVRDGSFGATAVSFRDTRVRGQFLSLPEYPDFRLLGEQLVEPLCDDELRLVLVLAEGLHVNGSQLVRGVQDRVPGVPVVGGLAGDGRGVGETLVLLGDELSSSGLVAVGFYGDRLQVGCGSLGGWDPFGPERRVTRAEGNVLYELDGRSALALYRKFLGSRASELPTSALLFPLTLRLGDSPRSLVRTVTGVCDVEECLTFAGDIPQGALARLMRANLERLIDGATAAAESSLDSLAGPPELALLISCVGRKMVLQQRVEEEVEGVRDVVGTSAALTGFYSLGEISPFVSSGRCELHNQTMTVTGLRESDPIA